MKQTKIIKILSFVLIFAIVLAGCSKKKNVGASEDNPTVAEREEQEQYVFGYSCADMENPYYATLGDIIAEVAEENGHKLLTKNPNNDSDKQIEQIKWMIEQGINAIILAPIDREAITPALELLDDADVKIINVDTQVKELDQVDAYVGSDNKHAGYLCGKDLIERFPEGGKILILESANMNSVNERIRGFEETIASQGFEVVGRDDTESNVDISAIAVKKLLEENPNVQAIMCGNDRIALGALKAVEELKLKDICIYGIDGSPEVKQELAKGNSPIVATVGQSLIDIGRSAVQVGIQMLDKEKYEEEIYEEAFLITAENVAMYGSDGWN